jgi:putative methyltransferase (TIGR04325 family)
MPAGATPRQGELQMGHMPVTTDDEDTSSVTTREPLGTSRIAASLKRARIRQIQLCSRGLRLVDSVPRTFAVIKWLRRLPVVRTILAAMTGYNKPFSSLSNAEAAISGYEGGGHCSVEYLENTAAHGQRLQLSDYPALFYIRPLLPDIKTVFDLGGGVGSLFYSYSKYIAIPSDLTWTVYDLPKTLEIGDRIARERSERRLRFTDRITDGEGVDLFIGCGSLHYFEMPLPDLLTDLTRKPRYVLVNRTPLVDGPPVATAQDGGTYRLACKLHNRLDLIHRFEAIGYELVADWRTSEASVIIPCYPDLSAPNYSGMFFQLKG